MLDSLAAFLRQHLVCSDHQLAILALWILHTWCLEDGAYSTAPYLYVRSPESESGKTLCLQLLSLLSRSAWTVTAPDPRVLMQHLIAYHGRQHQGAQHETASVVPRPSQVLLFDDCHLTLGAGKHQPLLTLLASGAAANCTYLCRLPEEGRRSGKGTTGELSFFSPKVFAGIGPLPRPLADRCIPIVLRRKKPSDPIRPLEMRCPTANSQEPIASLRRQLETWVANHSAALKANSQELSAGYPMANGQELLSPRQRDCAEPLLCLAQMVGGHWSEKARAALSSLFNCAPASPSLQLLADIRFVFLILGNPCQLSSRSLIEQLAALENRPWADWNQKSGRFLARLLQPFGIGSLNLYFRQTPREAVNSCGTGALACALGEAEFSIVARGSQTFKGYRLSDFHDAWERYLPPLPARLLDRQEQEKVAELNPSERRQPASEADTNLVGTEINKNGVIPNLTGFARQVEGPCVSFAPTHPADRASHPQDHPQDVSAGKHAPSSGIADEALPFLPHPPEEDTLPIFEKFTPLSHLPYPVDISWLALNPQEVAAPRVQSEEPTSDNSYGTGAISCARDVIPSLAGFEGQVEEPCVSCTSTWLADPAPHPPTHPPDVSASNHAPSSGMADEDTLPFFEKFTPLIRMGNAELFDESRPAVWHSQRPAVAGQRRAVAGRPPLCSPRPTDDGILAGCSAAADTALSPADLYCYPADDPPDVSASKHAPSSGMAGNRRFFGKLARLSRLRPFLRNPRQDRKAVSS